MATPDAGLAKAIKAVGTRYRLAQLLNLHNQSVYGWTRIPVPHIIKTEEVTGVPREVLRPDIHPVRRK
jgi:DNA-binding transcriptional regulator YdaS (Cro superfamily)